MLMSCCCQSNPQMYSCGGTSSGPVTTLCDKTNMTLETTAAATTANLSLARATLAAAANPGVAGYYGGGVTTNTTAVMDKLNFSNDTTSAITTGNLSVARDALTGLSERSSKCYFSGGETAGGGSERKVTDVLTFSGDSTSAATTADLSVARAFVTGLTQGSTKGYFAGGRTFTGAVFVYLKTADKITFSGDSTSAQTTANLSSTRGSSAGGSDGSTQGFWGGGFGGSIDSTVDKITFSTDTTAVLSSSSLPRFNTGYASDGTTMFAMSGSILADVTGFKAPMSTGVFSGLGAGANLSSNHNKPTSTCTVGL